MELLGSKNNEEDIVKSVSILNRKLLLSNILQEEDIQNILKVLIYLADSNDIGILFDGETTAFLLALSNNLSVMSVPLINNLTTELRLKMIRVQCLKMEDTTISGAKSVTAEKKEKERFTPTESDGFILPPVGEITNLTVTEPDYKTGKILIRDVMIDHEGYLVEEKSRRYEDIYTDESEEIYNNAYLTELKLYGNNKNA